MNGVRAQNKSHGDTPWPTRRVGSSAASRLSKSCRIHHCLLDFPPPCARCRRRRGTGCGARGYTARWALLMAPKSSWAIVLPSTGVAVRRRALPYDDDEAEEGLGVCVTIPSRRVAAVLSYGRRAGGGTTCRTDDERPRHPRRG